MKIPEIKKIVETYTIEELEAAENAILEGETLAIEIGGVDEGEQLTHAMAAIWVKKRILETNADVMTTIREYTSKVRNSIN